MLDQAQNSLLTLLQEDEEQILSGSRERLHLPVAKQGRGQGVLQGGETEGFWGAAGRQVRQGPGTI